MGLLGAVVVISLVAVAVRPGTAAPRQQPDAVARLFLPLTGQGARRDGLPGPPTPVVTLAPPSTEVPPATDTATPPSPTPLPTGQATLAPSDCGTINTFETGRRPLGELHVATTGDDRSGDGSSIRPFATIRHAAQLARPGTAIRLHPGTFPGGVFLEDLRGREDAPIWLGGLPGAPRPTLDGGGQGLHLVRPAWLVVHDLEIRRSVHNGLNADDGGEVANPEAGQHVIFRDLTIADVGGTGNQDCLKISGLRDFHVLDSVMRACGGAGSGSGIDVVGGHRGLIARNDLADMSANAVQVKGGSDDILIVANRMRNAGGRAVNLGGSTGFDYFRPPLSAAIPNAEARNIRVVANLIEGSDAPLAFVGCVDCLAAHNTLVNPDRWVLRILQETSTRDGFVFEPVRDGVFVNNLVYFNRSRLRTFVNIGPGTAPETFTFAHNLWYAHDDAGRSAPELPAPEVGAVVGRHPLLGVDYVPEPGSPALGAGRPIGVQADASGSCYAEPPAIGAFEGRR